MKNYYKVILINSFEEEEIHNRVEDIDYLVGLEDNSILRVEKLTDEEFKETKEEKWLMKLLFYVFFYLCSWALYIRL